MYRTKYFMRRRSREAEGEGRVFCGPRARRIGKARVFVFGHRREKGGVAVHWEAGQEVSGGLVRPTDKIWPPGNVKYQVSLAQNKSVCGDGLMINLSKL